MAKLTAKDTKLQIQKINMERKYISKKLAEQKKTEELGEDWKEKERQEVKDNQLFKRIADDGGAPKLVDTADLYDMFDPICKLKDESDKGLEVDLDKFMIGQYKYREALKRLNAEFKDVKKIVDKLSEFRTIEKADEDWKNNLSGVDPKKLNQKKKDSGWWDYKDGRKNIEEIALGEESIQNHVGDETTGETGSKEGEESFWKYKAIPTDIPDYLKGVEESIAKATKAEGQYAKIKRRALGNISNYINRFVPVYNRYVCSSCGVPKPIGEYYIVFSMSNGAMVDVDGNLHMSSCKECSNKVLMYFYKTVCKKNIEMAMEMTCAACNIYWDIHWFAVAKERFEFNDRKGSLLGEYIDIVNSEAPCKSFVDSPFLKDRYTKDLLYEIKQGQEVAIDKEIVNAMIEQYQRAKEADFGPVKLNGVPQSADAIGEVKRGRGRPKKIDVQAAQAAQATINGISEAAALGISAGASAADILKSLNNGAGVGVGGINEQRIQNSGQMDVYSSGAVHKDVNGWDETYDWSKADFKNKKEVIRIIGYDPFTYVSEAEDKKTLYRDLLNLVDDDDVSQDFIKVQSARSIVVAFFHAREYDKDIALLQEKLKNIRAGNGRDEESEDAINKKLKEVTALKKNELDSITQFASNNGWSERYKTKVSKGETTFSGIMKSMVDKLYEGQLVNRYDIATSDSMQQVANISVNAINKQLSMSDAEAWQTVQEQYNALVKLRKENAKLTEELRQVKYLLSARELEEKKRQIDAENGIENDENEHDGDDGEYGDGGDLFRKLSMSIGSNGSNGGNL